MTTFHRHLLAVAALAGTMAAWGPAVAGEPMAMDHEHHHHDRPTIGATHALRSIGRYQVPDVTLTDAEGRRTPLRSVLADKDPLMLNFIYTSCTSVCPVMSGIFSQVQARLGKEVHLVSISIDPEYDTPERLKAYARRFSAGPHWKMLTGRLQDSIAVQRAFETYRGDKMDHAPTTFLRAAPDRPWVRLDGIASADELVQEYRQLAASKP